MSHVVFLAVGPNCRDDELALGEESVQIDRRRIHTQFGDRRLTPDGVAVRNPAFDVTPAKLVDAIFTERGVIDPVGPERIAALGG